jgi:hypothetical protein
MESYQGLPEVGKKPPEYLRRRLDLEKKLVSGESAHSLHLRCYTGGVLGG